MTHGSRALRARPVKGFASAACRGALDRPPAGFSGFVRPGKQSFPGRPRHGRPPATRGAGWEGSAHQGVDGLGNAVGGGEQIALLEVGVALRAGEVAVPQQLARMNSVSPCMTARLA